LGRIRTVARETTLTIEIDHLTETELIDLNNRIVERSGRLRSSRMLDNAGTLHHSSCGASLA